MMYPGNIISGVNIQFRGFNKISSMPKLYTTEHTLFTSIPRSEYLINVVDDYKLFMNKSEVSVFIFLLVIILTNTWLEYSLIIIYINMQLCKVF